MSGSESSARGASAPPEPLGLTVHSMPSPVGADVDRRTRAGRWQMVLILAVCAAPVIASYFLYFVVRPSGHRSYAELIQPTRSLPADLPLTAPDGTRVPAPDLKRQWLLIAVGGGRCESACEKRLHFQRQFTEMLGRDKRRIDKLWLVTDGEPIRPELAAALAAGQPVTVLRVPRERLAAWLEPATGHALEEHLYLVDPMGEWMMRAPVDPDPRSLKGDFDRLMRASASWDQDGR